MNGNDTPRTLLISQRALDPAPHRTLAFELEDCIVDLDGADLVAPWRRDVTPPDLVRRVGRKLERTTGLMMSYRPPMVRQRLSRDYDLLVVVAQRARDLEALDAVDGWQDRCTVKVAWIEELWSRDVVPSRRLLRHLDHFDQVFLGVYWTVSGAHQSISRTIDYLTPAVDALAVCPRPGAFRPIDVYAMGRRAPQTHRALLQMAERDDLFYLYDSGWPDTVTSSKEHRRLLASLISRTRYFLVNPAKRNRPEDTGGQEEVGLRFFEGAAGGAVMLGEAPDVPSFAENFDWPDAVLPMRFDETDVASVLAEYDAQPERLERARRNNVVNALLRHDVVYRFERILEVAGLRPRPMVAHRKRTLSERALEFAEPRVPVAKPVA